MKPEDKRKFNKGKIKYKDRVDMVFAVERSVREKFRANPDVMKSMLEHGLKLLEKR